MQRIPNPNDHLPNDDVMGLDLNTGDANNEMANEMEGLGFSRDGRKKKGNQEGVAFIDAEPKVKAISVCSCWFLIFGNHA